MPSDTINASIKVGNVVPPFEYGAFFLADLGMSFIVISVIVYFMIKDWQSYPTLKKAIPIFIFSLGFSLVLLYSTPYVLYSPIYNGSNVTYILSPYSSGGSTGLIMIATFIMATSFIYLVYAFLKDVIGLTSGGSEGYYIP